MHNALPMNRQQDSEDLKSDGNISMLGSLSRRHNGPLKEWQAWDCFYRTATKIDQNTPVLNASMFAGEMAVISGYTNTTQATELGICPGFDIEIFLHTSISKLHDNLAVAQNVNEELGQRDASKAASTEEVFHVHIGTPDMGDRRLHLVNPHHRDINKGSERTSESEKEEKGRGQNKIETRRRRRESARQRGKTFQVVRPEGKEVERAARVFESRREKRGKEGLID
ncbi:hypothetical protein BC827DRAFT_1156809 [Russula dissimulans]|nr:hypothetical protein BC827DRAFT_1156809 [Russula dissimulans]